MSEVGDISRLFLSSSLWEFVSVCSASASPLIEFDSVSGLLGVEEEGSGILIGKGSRRFPSVVECVGPDGGGLNEGGPAFPKIILMSSSLHIFKVNQFQSNFQVKIFQIRFIS